MDESESDERRRRRKLVGISIVAVLAAVIVPANWRIASKAGYPPVLSLLSIVSPINLLMLLGFAAREWPIERELRLARQGNGRAQNAIG